MFRINFCYSFFAKETYFLISIEKDVIMVLKEGSRRRVEFASGLMKLN